MPPSKDDDTTLVALREALGMSQRQLAAASGISQSHISRLERLRSRDLRIRPETARALARALRRQVSDIFDPAINIVDHGRTPFTDETPRRQFEIAEVHCPNCNQVGPLRSNLTCTICEEPFQTI